MFCIYKIIITYFFFSTYILEFFKVWNHEIINDSDGSNGVFDSKGEPNKDGIGMNPPHCSILGNWVFENFMLADEPFAKALQIFGTCVSVNNNLCGKLVLSLKFLIKFDERFKITSVPFFYCRF